MDMVGFVNLQNVVAKNYFLMDKMEVNRKVGQKV
jgi:hypothetical protein